MKPILIALTVAALLAAVPATQAWLGDSEQDLLQRYGKPRAAEMTTGDIPTQRGYYAELKENFGTNVSLIASTVSGYNDESYGMDLVETRNRCAFEKDGSRIVVYVGNTNEMYNGVDFSGRSAREVINCRVVWQKNKNGDKLAHPVAFSPAAITAVLENNKGDSTWADAWQSISIPGTYIRRTADKTRLAIAHGPSENEIYRLEVRMVDDASRATN